MTLIAIPFLKNIAHKNQYVMVITVMQVADTNNVKFLINKYAISISIVVISRFCQGPTVLIKSFNNKLSRAVACTSTPECSLLIGVL